LQQPLKKRPRTKDDDDDEEEEEEEEKDWKMTRNTNDRKLA
jgi:hypothetical protein